MKKNKKRINDSSETRTKKRRALSIRKFILCLFLLGIIFLAYHVYNSFFNKATEVTKPKVVDEIKTFNYALNENDTKLFKDTFKELKKVLSEKEVDNKKYAETVAKLFIIDFFSLDNKSSKNDIGGVQFVYSKFKTDFVDYARNSIYKQVNNNIDSKEKQNLPLVDSIKINSVEEVVPSQIFEHPDFSESNEPDAYEVSLDWSYKNNDNFQTSTVLTIVKDGSKLSVAKMTE